MKKNKVLVTGGNGFIGSALTRRLVNEGYRVRILDSNLRGKPHRLKDIKGRVEMIRGDIRDRKIVAEACKGVNTVCHLAYLNGTEFFYKRPDLVLDIGVKGMVNVIDACILENVKDLILLSSSEVYQTPPTIPTDEKVTLSIPDPLNPRYSYGGGKIISELMAINYGRKYFKKVIIARPHNVYGPDMGREHVIPEFLVRMKKLCLNSKNKRTRFPIRGVGKETRSFIFIDDFINGLMLVMKKGRHLGVYNIGTTEEIPVTEVARRAGAYFGKKVVIVPGKIHEGGTSRRCPDISKIKKLGYVQKVPFSEGFNITAKWYDENAEKKPAKTKRRVEREPIYL